jgi:hypothetical protein
MISCNSAKIDNANVNAAGVFFRAGNNENKPLKLESLDYMKWFESENNGVRVNKKIGKFAFSALYKPYEYLALQELKSGGVNRKVLDEKKAEYEGLQYFTFRISVDSQNEELLKVDLKSDKEYYSRIEYFSFDMQNDIRLIDGVDTLNCSLFHFERVYGLAPYATFVLGFPLTKAETSDRTAYKKTALKDKTLLYEDKIFGSGNIYMTITAENLNAIPELLTN